MQAFFIHIPSVGLFHLPLQPLFLESFFLILLHEELIRHETARIMLVKKTCLDLDLADITAFLNLSEKILFAEGAILVSDVVVLVAVGTVY